MPLVLFHELMAAAQRGGYAVGYFESWGLASLLAVADAAQALRSPVILGFSGIYLPHPERTVRDPLAAYAAMGLEVAHGLSVPCCLLFNESPHLEWVRDAIDRGFSLVMYTRDDLAQDELMAQVCQVVAKAHTAGAAVEGERAPLEGVGGDLAELPGDRRLTGVEEARNFVERTGVDALAVNIGQAHLHGRRNVRLDLDRLRQLREAIAVPLVLHGATSVDRDDLREAVRIGVRKVNVGSLLKKVYFRALHDACLAQKDHPNPYDVVGSGLSSDVLVAGRLAVQAAVEDFMHCLGSVGKAGRPL